ncbi:MAG: universal stress protein [Thermodesulfobacteriota bacterium]
MVCYDGSETARTMLETAMEMFLPLKPEVQLIMVIPDSGTASMENEETYTDWQKERHDALTERAQWVTEQGDGLEVDAIMATGEPRSQIVEAVERKKPDMVIVGRLGETRMQRMLLGTVAAHLVRHASSPVLVI